MSDQTPPPADPAGHPPAPPRPPRPAPGAQTPPPPGPPAGGAQSGHAPKPSTSFGQGFFGALFDITFRTFITRRLATVFYVVGLVVIAIAFLGYLIAGLVAGFGAMRFDVATGILLLLGTLVLVPVLSFLAVIVLRFWIEAVVALIAVAENTGRTAENTESV
ncbi:DUF4282 domain-containing protein [Microbacterium aquimaris]|uniref:DUF4282 domain-containing protein n=1 Tax=Microbacterium aquimaris TaxID=459816 RepID=UPI002AD40EA3|nr:DUF4282 domain-containing protein [Microbacterium aquimaris]MDZ8274430.1 DUF4282 domain-containing protein [Microbacterium aquimaris]